MLADALQPEPYTCVKRGIRRKHEGPQRFMEAILVSSAVFVVVFGGALIGMKLRLVVPQTQLGPEVKDVIRLAVGLLVTMTALVLGMLVSTANSSYQQRQDQLTQMASDFVGVDRLLGSYGPETKAARLELHSLAEASLQRIWPNQGFQDAEIGPTDTGQIFYNQLQLLVPKNDAQVAVKAATISAAIGLRRTYWLMFLGSEGSSLSRPLLVVVVSWLTAIFISFGLFAPRNNTVFVTLLICAVAVSAAVFIIMAMYTPFSGVMKISSLPLRDALIRMTP
jgi:hypothetical protein